MNLRYLPRTAAGRLAARYLSAALGLLLPVAAFGQPGLAFSTYLGGPQDDRVQAVAFDDLGNVYAAGRTFTPPISSFPLAWPPFNTFDGGVGRADYDVLVTKFSPEGDVVYSAIFGGPGWDEALAIAVDDLGRAHVAGFAGPGFPLVDPIELYQSNPDVFVAVLDPGGTSLVFSTYLSGAGAESAHALALDDAGNVYVAGVTSSDENTFVPTTPTFDNDANGLQDGFLAKLDYSGGAFPRVVYKTFMGTSDDDRATALAVDAGGAVVVGGVSAGDDFDNAPDPLAQTMPGGFEDGFLLRINSSGVGAQFFTWLGGEDIDTVEDLELTEAGDVWATGLTYSAFFPTTADAIRTTAPGGFNDAWFARINPAGNDLLYSSYWGGFMGDLGDAIVLAGDDVILVGSTDSANFPLTPDALQSTHAGVSDIFVSRFANDGKELVYSTFLGGNDTELYADAAWRDGALAFAGYTFSRGANGYPTTPGAPQQSAPSSANGFVTAVTFEGGGDSHPADSNQDFRISIAEITAYGFAWKNGNPWPTGPTPIPIDFVTRAGFLWRQGEAYRDAGGQQPGNWVPDP